MGNSWGKHAYFAPNEIGDRRFTPTLLIRAGLMPLAEPGGLGQTVGTARTPLLTPGRSLTHHDGLTTRLPPPIGRRIVHRLHRRCPAGAGGDSRRRRAGDPAAFRLADREHRRHRPHAGRARPARTARPGGAGDPLAGNTRPRRRPDAEAAVPRPAVRPGRRRDRCRADRRRPDGRAGDRIGRPDVARLGAVGGGRARPPALAGGDREAIRHLWRDDRRRLQLDAGRGRARRRCAICSTTRRSSTPGRRSRWRSSARRA